MHHYDICVLNLIQCDSSWNSLDHWTDKILLIVPSVYCALRDFDKLFCHESSLVLMYCKNHYLENIGKQSYKPMEKKTHIHTSPSIIKQLKQCQNVIWTHLEVGMLQEDIIVWVRGHYWLSTYFIGLEHIFNELIH